jgi:hypothetical protein
VILLPAVAGRGIVVHRVIVGTKLRSAEAWSELLCGGNLDNFRFKLANRKLFRASPALGSWKIQSGLANSRRSSQDAGREYLWTISPRRLVEAQRHLDDIARGWDDAMARRFTYKGSGDEF